MIVTAVAIGTRGDVQPLAELGQEMTKRGHTFRVAALEKFKDLIEAKGVGYIHLDGDADLLMKLLVTEYKTSGDFVKGCEKLYHSVPGIMDQIAEAVKGSDLVMYGLLAGFARHACDLYHIPCIRLFYSPFDKTNRYSLYTAKHNSFTVGMTYLSEEPGMNLLTLRLANSWIKEHGLKKWKMTDDYRKQNGRPVLTFYPVTPILMPPDPKWGQHIHVTGYWYHPDAYKDYIPENSLKVFLEEGEKPVFICFGKAESEELRELQKRTLLAVNKLKIRAVIQADQISEKDKAECGGNVFFTGNVPYEWIFEKVKAVVHHGGCTTNGIGIRAGCPTLILALALDQYYFGRAIYENGLGPKPLYIRKKLCSQQQIEDALSELVTGKFDQNAAAAAERIKQENGCKLAADIMEHYKAAIDKE